MQLQIERLKPEFHDFFYDDKPEGPQKTNAAATTAVTPAATNIFSPSMSINQYRRI